VVDTLLALGLPVWDDELDTRSADGRRRVLEGLSEFREHLGGDLTITLLAGIGRGVDVHEMREDLVDTCIERLRGEARS